jgi:hypothetical protein
VVLAEAVRRGCREALVAGPLPLLPLLPLLHLLRLLTLLYLLRLLTLLTLLLRLLRLLPLLLCLLRLPLLPWLGRRPGSIRGGGCTHRGVRSGAQRHMEVQLSRHRVPRRERSLVQAGAQQAPCV